MVRIIRKTFTAPENIRSYLTVLLRSRRHKPIHPQILHHLPIMIEPVSHRKQREMAFEQARPCDVK